MLLDSGVKGETFEKCLWNRGGKTNMLFNLKATAISRDTYNLDIGKEDRTVVINLSLEKNHYLVTNDFMCT